MTALKKVTIRIARIERCTGNSFKTRIRRSEVKKWVKGVSSRRKF